LTRGNEKLVAQALEEIDVDASVPVTPESIHLLFRSAKKPKNGVPTPAGPASGSKGEFALALAALIRDARRTGTPVSVPAPVSEVLDFLYATLLQPPAIDPTEGEMGGQADGEGRNEVNDGDDLKEPPA
jgi:putative ATP-dependent endonuclease of OLD family